jgi:hypothetical protein
LVFGHVVIPDRGGEKAGAIQRWIRRDDVDEVGLAFTADGGVATAQDFDLADLVHLDRQARQTDRIGMA